MVGRRERLELAGRLGADYLINYEQAGRSIPVRRLLGVWAYIKRLSAPAVIRPCSNVCLPHERTGRWRW